MKRTASSSVETKDKPAREIEALRERISMLSAACLRISASLDLETVLREIVDSARALIEARYGGIVTIDESGQPRDFNTSGFTDAEHRRMADWPDGPRFFEHLRDLTGVLRLPDARAYAQSLGFALNRQLSGTFLGMPMRHRGQHVGNFYLVEKEGGAEFSSEDEEILVLFASQAATAIANARTYQAEQRARADLEALVETSPVGVLVFEARTGRLMSINQEAKRIVEGVRMPGSPPEALLEQVTFKRADGREIALGKLPLSQVLNRTEVVRAEEIVLSVPDGRTVTTLVNCTPIHSEEGAVVSVVVTMQDLAPLQELERLRAEFLGMVSHELRSPLTSIKGSASTLLEAAPKLDPAEMREFYRIILAQADHMRVLISDLLDAGRIDTGTLSVSPEPSEVADLVDRARTTFQSGGGRHPVLIDLPHDLPRVMADRQRIEQVLNNLFSNAVRHAPESSPIRVSAVQDGVHVAVTVRDEGAGIAADRLPHLFQKYVGLKGGDREAETAAGSGLGLAICKGLVEAHGGRIRAESDGVGQGTRITFTIPVADEVGKAGKIGEAGKAVNTANEPVRTDTQDAEGTGEPTRILVVDDDPQTLRYVREALTAAGYSALVTSNHEELPGIIQAERPELVLLDLLLPGTDGIELMERLPELADLPVIFISAYGRDETIARALDTGAADYLVKPFSTTELVARIRAALHRRADPEPFVLGKLNIDYDRRRVSVGGVRVELTATEYELLRVLSLNAGRVLTFDTLMRQVWGSRAYANQKLVRAFVKKLRQKLGDDARKPVYLFNERGVGYRMARPGEP
ncbi:MAG: response regulator [Gemmatimonadetes bacterium]|nr:response regulator [Gemmatimonadota bacterium]